MADSRSADIAASVAAAQPRILVLVAPAGYGKSLVARSLAAQAGSLHICRLPLGGDEMARAVLDALVASDHSRAARLAADRLARRHGSSSTSAREMLRREWRLSIADDVFLLHDAVGALATPAGADLCAELAGTLPAQRRLIVATRTPLPPAVAAALSPEETMTVARDTLALTEPEVELLARHAGLDRRDAARLFTAAHGWPLVTRLLIERMRTDSDSSALEGVGTLPNDAVLDFVAHRTVAGLARRVREALVVASLFARAKYLDIVRILGPECDDAVFARMTSLPFVERDGEDAIIHPEITRLLRERFVSVVEPLYERTLMVLSRAGRHFAAASIALDAGDGLRAAEIAEAAPPFTAAPIPIGECERVIERLEPRFLTRFPNLWVATIPYRSFSLDSATYIREAETIYFCLPARAGVEQRAAVLMLLASAYTNVGRAADAAALLVEALAGFAGAESGGRASLLNFMASLRGIEGRFSEARRLAEEAARISRDSFGENQTLHYIEAHEAAYRGRQDRVTVILDELMQRRTGTDPPLYRAYVAMNGALFSWANGDDAAFERYQTAFEDGITPAVEAALGMLIEAARGRPASGSEEHPWPLVTAVTQLYRMAHAATPERAREAARSAARAADRRGAPYTRTLAHVAVYMLDEAARPQEAGVLRQIVSAIESPELRRAVDSVLAGRPAGILEPFVRRRVLRERVRSEPRLVVELLAGRVTRDGESVRLRGKEFELVALLASTRGSLSRDEIGEALWEHLDTNEWRNNLKVTMYRVRKALASRALTATEGLRHRLAPAVDVDLRRGEVLVRDLRTPLDDTVRGQLHAVMEALREGAIERYEQFAWSHTLVARLHDLACACGLALAGDALAHGRVDEALAYAGRVREVDSLDEKACEITIRALVASGAVDAARRELQRYAAALNRELAASPPTLLVDLVRSLV
jgi:DNA-binding SARP family transcriptional activator